MGQGDEVWKVVSVSRITRWIFKGTPSSKPVPKGGHLLGLNVNHQGERREIA
jgi:hypothetical protein